MPHEVVVVRLGVFATDLPTWRERVAAEVAGIARGGVGVVVVHGGGPRVDELAARLGRRPSYAEGLPVVDAQGYEAWEMGMLATGKDLAAALGRAGARGLGLGGRDGGLVHACPLPGRGAVGEVEAVDAAGLGKLLEDGFVPVLAALASGPAGGLLVSTDDLAARLAGALRARLLLALDPADGVVVHGERAARLTPRQVDLLLSQGAVPPHQMATLAALTRAVREGAAQARLVDVRAAGGLAKALAGEDVGTLVAGEGGGRAATRGPGRTGQST